MPQLKLGSSSLSGAGADVAFATVTEGNQLAGSFALTFDGKTTSAIPYDASASVVKSALEALHPSVGTVNVETTVEDIDAQWGRAWTVTFTSDTNKGDVAALGTDFTALEGTGAKVVVCVDGDSNGDCSAHTASVRGNQLGGSFDLQDSGGNTCTIQHDSSAADFKTAVESLPTIGTVTVERSPKADANGGYTWDGIVHIQSW